MWIKNAYYHYYSKTLSGANNDKEKRISITLQGGKGVFNYISTYFDDFHLNVELIISISIHMKFWTRSYIKTLFFVYGSIITIRRSWNFIVEILSW